MSRSDRSRSECLLLSALRSATTALRSAMSSAIFASRKPHSLFAARASALDSTRAETSTFTPGLLTTVRAGTASCHLARLTEDGEQFSGPRQALVASVGLLAPGLGERARREGERSWARGGTAGLAWKVGNVATGSV